jgi:predicted nucleotidyltransferase component of viral defense system
MSDHFYKSELYPLQDQVLQIVGGLNSDFFLTGGTVVSRYLFNHRYSDDLDFFINRDSNFNGKAESVINAIGKVFPEIERSTRFEDYHKYFVRNNNVQLKIEFVNDVKYRKGIPARDKDGVLIDTWENILSNKVAALSRFEGKDFVDILFIAANFEFNWEKVILDAREKDLSVNEIEVSELLLKFSPNILSKVVFPSTFDKDKIEHKYFQTLARESLHGFDNSLYGTKL